MPPDLKTPADLRRATSDMYYALFHRVFEALVFPLGADAENKAFRDTYVTLYRLPDHGFLEKRCKEVETQGFSEAVAHFAQLIIAFKNKRQSADYDPLQKQTISLARNDLNMVKKVLDDLSKVAPDELTRFAYFVSLRGRKRDSDSDV